MKSKPLFVMLMVVITVGFGSAWHCKIEINEKPSKSSQPKDEPPPSGGCLGQQPIHTQGEPQPYEYTIIVGVFDPNQNGHAEALQLSKNMREKRIHNHVYRAGQGCWVVSVGRYLDRSQADKMGRTVQSKGYARARVDKPAHVTCDDP